ncbi:MAG: hypothetical protein ACFB20_10130 [Opitutales bacterium]
MNPVQFCHKATGVARNLAHLDRGPPEAVVVLTGMPRSGTTWLGGVLQQASGWRSLFEPLFPRYVRASVPFGYFPYRDAASTDAELRRFLSRVLRGKLRGRWVDRDNARFVFRGRIVKEVRWNFLLGWVQAHWPSVPLILIVRRPMPVLRSWQTLGWLKDAQLARQAFALPHLLQDKRFKATWPRLAGRLLEAGQSNDPLLSFALQWHLSMALPLSQLPDQAYRIAGYEALTRDPAELGPLLDFARLPAPARPLAELAGRRSSTDFGTRAAQSAKRAPEPGPEAKAAFVRATECLDVGGAAQAEAFLEEPLSAWQAFDATAWTERWRG